MVGKGRGSELFVDVRMVVAVAVAVVMEVVTDGCCELLVVVTVTVEVEKGGPIEELGTGGAAFFEALRSCVNVSCVTNYLPYLML